MLPFVSNSNSNSNRIPLKYSNHMKKTYPQLLNEGIYIDLDDLPEIYKSKCCLFLNLCSFILCLFINIILFYMLYIL